MRMRIVSDRRQKAILPRRGRIALSANERIAEFLDFAIQAKFAYVNKLNGRDARPRFVQNLLFAQLLYKGKEDEP